MRVVVATLLAACLVPTVAQAARVVDTDKLQMDVGGDVKGFFDALFPYEHLIMPEDPIATAALDFRFKFSGDYSTWLSWEVDHALTARFIPGGDTSFGLAAGTAQPIADEALTLSYTAVDTPNFTLRGRFDRLNVSFHLPGFDAKIGRQPVSFGTGLFFTPMDLLAPYTPQVVDREYKPGVDAIRLDGFFGATGRLTGVVGVIDEFDLEGLFVAGYGGFTVGVTDLNFFAAKIRKDLVVGMGTATSIGPVGVHADLTVTVPFEGDERCPGANGLADEDDACPPFVRAVVGADVRTAFGMSLAGELYVQTAGATDSTQYLKVATRPRFVRGELWTMGTFYGAFSLTQEIIPIVFVNVSVLTNFLDPSFLIGPGLTWSVSENAEVSFGGFIALGSRPEDVELIDLINPETFEPLTETEALEVLKSNSEFGLSPSQFYAQLKFYF